jgi:hypothetical protein
VTEREAVEKLLQITDNNISVAVRKAFIKKVLREIKK